jgi:hypothetical protein
MPHDWRTRELVNQWLLVFAFGVRRSLLGDATPAVSPRDTLLFAPSMAELFTKWSESRPHPARDASEFRRHIEANLNQIVKLGEIPKNLAKIGRAAPWTVGEVVGWWITAGLAIANWRSSDLAEARRSQVGIGAPRPERMSPGVVWDATIRRLQIDDDEIYPPMWCADLADNWRLVAPGEHPEGWPESWSSEARGPDPCRAALLEWCGDPARELASKEVRDPGAVDAWAGDYERRHHDFAREALRLLRRRCRFDAESVPRADATHRWRIVPTESSPPLSRVLRRPLVAADEAREGLLVSGCFVTPWPKLVLEKLRRSLTQAASVPGSTARALAAAAWQAQDRTFGPLPPWDHAGASNDTRAVMTRGVERLVALARLCVVVPCASTTCTEDGDSTPRARSESHSLADAIAHEGYRWSSTAAAAPTDRRIPLGVEFAAPPANGSYRVCLAREGSDLVVDVGCCGPAARCGETLLAAVEELDWRWWGLNVALSNGMAADPTADDPLVTFDWEALKRGLLDLDHDCRSSETACALAGGFAALHDLRLGLEASAAERPVHRDLLADRVEALNTEILRLLKTIDPNDLGGLHPPRAFDTSIDLATWLTDERHRCDGRTSGWTIAWKRSVTPLGRAVSERRPGPDGRRSVDLSAGGGATDDDLRLLDAMEIVTGAASGWDRLWLPLQAQVAESLQMGRPLDLPAAIDEMRTSWGADSADAFHAVVSAAVAGDSRAVACLRVMHDDPRFRFACHPPISVDERGVCPLPAAIDHPLEWQDSDVPVNGDVELAFTVDPSRGRRVVSRGRPDQASAEAIAGRLAAAIPADDAALATSVRELRHAIDRRRMFADDAPSPLPLIAEVADAIRAAASADTWVGTAFRELAACCAACGGSLIPAEWDPAAGSPAEGFDSVPVRFHKTVPLGRVVVERFGVAAADGGVPVEAVVFKSAGPEPTGYSEVVEKVDLLTNRKGALEKLWQFVHDVPWRVEKGQTTVGPNLFEAAWEAKASQGRSDDIEAVVQAVHRFLERAYGMTVFVPKELDDVPEGWVKTREDGKPQGNRIDRVLCPGVKTRDGKLIRSAIVEME